MTSPVHILVLYVELNCSPISEMIFFNISAILHSMLILAAPNDTSLSLESSFEMNSGEEKEFLVLDSLLSEFIEKSFKKMNGI